MPLQMPQKFAESTVVVGGTGMLAAATHWLAERSPRTLVVARRASRFAAGTSMLACDTDWDRDNFVTDLEDAVEDLGALGQVLLWLHDGARLLPQLAPLLQARRTVLVLGSMDGQPRIPHSEHELITVQLGSMPTAAGRRWLSHQEICDGAIAAFADGKSRIVGDLQAPSISTRAGTGRVIG